MLKLFQSSQKPHLRPKSLPQFSLDTLNLIFLGFFFVNLLSSARCDFLYPSVITEFHSQASSRTQNQRRNHFCSSRSTFFVVEEGERKESRRREKGLGRVEPGNTSLKEVNFITTLLSRQNTRHQTRTVLFHGCPAPPKQHMAELVEEWCHGQHNELWSALLCALCCMGGGKKKK